MEVITLTSAGLWPFSVSMALLLVLVFVELCGLVFHTSPSSAFDHFVAQRRHSAPCAWLHLGRVPSLILILLLLFGFSITGLIIQGMSWQWFGAFLSLWLTIPIALLCALLMVRTLSLPVGRSLVDWSSTKPPVELRLIGRMATICGGVARLGHPVQARVRDTHGRLHYIQVEPEMGELADGSDVILTHRIGMAYQARLRDAEHKLTLPTGHPPLV
jgi:hypothetical protein